MSTPVYINATEFMDLLAKRNFVIVHKSQLVDLEAKRQQLLRKADLSFSEIIKAEFFSVKDTDTLRRWCLAGKFGKDGFYQKKNGQYRIMTLALKTVLYGAS